jgi:hypothetical protein
MSTILLQPGSSPESGEQQVLADQALPPLPDYNSTMLYDPQSSLDLDTRMALSIFQFGMVW